MDHGSASLMDLVLAGQQLQQLLGVQGEFEQAVKSLVTAAMDADATDLLAADTDAAALVGGAILASQGGLRQARHDQDGALPAKVMVVAATIVSGNVLRRRVEEARNHGSSWVGAWAWRAPDNFDDQRLTADLALTDARYVPA